MEIFYIAQYCICSFYENNSLKMRKGLFMKALIIWNFSLNRYLSTHPSKIPKKDSSLPERKQ